MMLIAGEVLAQQGPGTNVKTEGNYSPIVVNPGSDVNIRYELIQEKEAFDARKELARRGIPWSADSFGKALLDGDVLAVKLFLKGKMDIYAEYQKTYAIAKFVSDTEYLKKFEEIFMLLINHGLDVDYPLEERLSPGKTTLAEHAVAGEHLRAFQLIWKRSKRKEAARIRAAIEQKLAERQKELHGESAAKARTGQAGAAALIRMLLEVDRKNEFVLTKHDVYAGPNGWVLRLYTNSVVEEVKYKINGQWKTVQNTVHLPIKLEDFAKPRTPVHIKARDVRGRALEVTLLIDREDIL
jgi:hypothetical protein